MSAFYFRDVKKHWPDTEEYIRVSWQDNRNPNDVHEWGRLGMTPDELTNAVYDWLSPLNRQHWLFCQNKLLPANDAHLMPYLIERFLYMSSKQVKEFRDWSSMCHVHMAISSQASWEQRQFARAVNDEIRERGAKSKNTLYDCVARAALKHRNAWHWCQKDIIKIIQEYIQKNPKESHGRLVPITSVKETKLFRQMNDTLNEAREYVGEIKEMNDYLNMKWYKYQYGRIVTCPSMVLSILNVKCSKITNTQHEVNNGKEVARDGTLISNTVMSMSSISATMLQNIEVTEMIESNKKNQISSPVLNKLQQAYKQIVC